MTYQLQLAATGDWIVIVGKYIKIIVTIKSYQTTKTIETTQSSSRQLRTIFLQQRHPWEALPFAIMNQVQEKYIDII